MQRRGVPFNANKTYMAIALALLLLTGAYFLFFYTPECKNQECFIQSLDRCSRSSFVNKQDLTATWQYTIKGSDKDFCKVYVTARSINAEDEETKSLEGKSMTCFIPLEVS